MNGEDADKLTREVIADAASHGRTGYLPLRWGSVHIEDVVPLG